MAAPIHHHPRAFHPQKDQHGSDTGAHYEPLSHSAYARYLPPGAVTSDWSPWQGGTPPGLDVVYTDDFEPFGKKLRGRLRRKCFNCYTTKSPTWRRSQLNRRKIVCNKCGMFKRSHSRARPEVLTRARSHTKTPKQQRQQSSQPYKPPSPDLPISTASPQNHNNTAIASNSGPTSSKNSASASLQTGTPKHGQIARPAPPATPVGERNGGTSANADAASVASMLLDPDDFLLVALARRVPI
ncbi:hypothetical protein B0H16DRAFT_1455130 [Mycena metata]|uniref:GATA-type domain-containing protein n=1 Tax=Mycena metata TaxID=1033252 RepID=A0AAD7NK84_9AGAR|nr:hypothetical protein B0H16DRAFT_1455130 [Mycena metata]